MITSTRNCIKVFVQSIVESVSLKMKSIVLLVLAGVCLAACAKVPVKSKFGKPAAAAATAFLIKQQKLLEILQHVHQNDVHKELLEVADTLDWELLANDFEDATVVQDYLTVKRLGLLARGEEFSVLRKAHIEEAVALFRVLHQAGDWESFYKVLVWARFNVNEGVFIYATTVAVLHRPDLEGIVLPAPYEVYPYYFFNVETIQAAQNAKMQGLPTTKKSADSNVLTILSNYTGWNQRTTAEQALSYFTEDIGLNSWYYYFHADYPFWVDSKDSLFKSRRGEVYLHTHAQLLARYYLERLSNNLGSIPQFTWRVPFRTGYNPALAYYGGAAFPVRNNFYSTYNEQTYYPIEKLESLETRVRFAIDHRFYTLPNGTIVDLSKPEAIESFANLYKFAPTKKDGKLFGLLEVLGRTLLGTATENYDLENGLPGVLEHFETSLRDPAFYQLYGRLIRYYLQWSNKLEPYTEEDVQFENVEIESVELDRLTTYFDTFDADITNAIDVEPVVEAPAVKAPWVKSGKKAVKDGAPLIIKARQYRLNHLPFTLKLNVLSDKDQRASIKVFIGPKYDESGHEFDLNENRENFYELDKFIVNLNAGRNLLSRSSDQFAFYSKDRTTYFDLYKTVMGAINGDEPLPADFSQSPCGFPQRLLLPKGKKGGLPVQLFVIVTEYRAPSRWVIQKDWFSASNCRRDIDARPLGFPLDRDIDESIWYTPNMKFIDTAIFHKSDADVNASLI